MTLPPEFSMIARYFRPLAGPGALDLSDDAALLDPPAGRQLVLAADAMVAGVHFLPDDPPETIGRKLLRANLSDLAAMGAVPLAYLLTVSLPRDIAPGWLEGFSTGLALDQAEYGLQVLGGDTTSTPGPISLSLTILGHVAPGTALRRSGAVIDDDIWVSGTIGDGTLGLAVLLGQQPPDTEGFLADRYRLPRPRVALGQALVGLASAAMDVSDGLVQDLGHLCRAAGLGAEIQADSVPLSDAGAALLARDAGLLPRILTGGDDYELIFAAPRAAAPLIESRAAACGVAVTRIGRFAAGEPLVTVKDGQGGVISLGSGGWSHF
jgi:thiamine-monophosphate kinase